MCQILGLFITDELSPSDIQSLVEETSADFSLPDWAQLAHVSATLSVLELYHGLTYSFKDYALAFVGEIEKRAARHCLQPV